MAAMTSGSVDITKWSATVGHFEMRGTVIGYSGVQGFEGWDRAKFIDTLSHYVSAPQTDLRDNGPTDAQGDTIIP